MQDCNKLLLSIIIPVHNQSVYTLACLASLAAFPPHVPYEIVVVDDGSTDDTDRLLKDATGTTNLIRSVRNDTAIGFAGACNYGAAEAQGYFLLFLNNDTEVIPGWCPPLLETLLDSPDVGIVGPKLIFPDRTIQHCGKVWSDPAEPNSQPHHLYYRFPADHPAVNKSRDYQLLTGACILVRAEEFKSLGGFDEGYENGWEDDDLCYKYRHIGKRIFYCAQSTIIHHQNKTLNERMFELGQQLPSADKLSELDNKLAGKTAGAQDIFLARHVQAIYEEMEAELLRFRSKFDRNRNRLLGKWGAMIKRDDYFYCTADGVPLSEVLHGEIPEQSSGDTEGDGPYSVSGKELQPLVSIVILTLNRLDVTKECVASIQRHTSELHEIIFVDNGSTDGSVGWLRDMVQRNSAYRLIENGTNLGFSRGCNQGIRAARGQYILLLNNDTVVTPAWLTGLLACFNGDDIGIVGPMTNNISGIQQWPWADYRDLKALDRFATAFRDRYRYRRIPARRIVGFCMLFRRGLVDRLGLLDEQFGSGNFEDDDFCLRSALEGYTNLIAGDVFIHHVGSATFLGNRIDYRDAMLSNQGLFNQKWSRPIADEAFAKKIIRLKTLEKAELLYQRGEANTAVEALLQDGIRQLPDEVKFYHTLARIFLENKMFQDALAVLRECPEQDGRTAILSGAALLGLGRIADSCQAVETLLAKGGETADTLILSGNIKLESEDLDAAGRAFEMALASDPGSAGAYAGLATLAGNAGDRELAFSLFERATMLNPTDPSIVGQFHAFAASRDDFERAVKILSEAHYFYPEDASVVYLLIDLLLKLERYPAAMALIEEVLVKFRFSEGLLDAARTVRSNIGPLCVDPERQRRGIAVSLCMIVKNEEKNLSRCLASLKPIVDEIIIADTGSTDHSREIAEIFGAKVIEIPWTGDFSAARNASIIPAGGNWILVMDADEVLSVLDHSRFQELVAASVGKRQAYTIGTRNYTNKVDLENWQPNRGEYPQEETGRGWMPSDKVRLFPNLAAIRFENPIHEMVEPALTRLGIADSKIDVVVHHYGYLDEDRQHQKKVQYYELGKRKLAESGGAPGAIVELAIQAAGIGRYDEAIALWHRALAYDPDSYLAYFNLGYAYLQKGMFREGSDASRRAMELRDNYREALINHLICELCLGHDSYAIGAVESAIVMNPEYPTLQLLRGVLYAVRGERESAFRDFRELTDANVEFSPFIHEVSVKLLQARRTDFADKLVTIASAVGCCKSETVELIASVE